MDATTVVIGEGGIICASCGKMKRTLLLDFEETDVHEYCECKSPSSFGSELLEITDATTAAAGEGGVIICALCGKMKRIAPPEFKETYVHEYCECESPSSSGRELLEITDAITTVVGEVGVICASCGKMKRTVLPNFEETHVHEYCECGSPSSSGRELLEITDATTTAADESGVILVVTSLKLAGTKF